MKLRGHGLETNLPSGWEGRITQRAASRPQPRRQDAPQRDPSTENETPQPPEAGSTAPVMHLANFALPEDRGDFGSGAVDVMGTGNVFIALIEYGADSARTALFREVESVPRITRRMFSANALQRIRTGQAGLQKFFTYQGRAFCLYVVLGDQRDAGELSDAVNEVTRSLTVSPR